MRIGILGVGAVGGFLGAKLALSGEQVTVFDRPEVIEPITARGLTIVDADGTRVDATHDFKAAADIAEAGRQDVVILATKADNLCDVAPLAREMCESHTSVVTVQNGLPWWYFLDGTNTAPQTVLKSLDPDGTLGEHIDAERVIGCVVYPALEVVEPGVIQHVYGLRMPVGEAVGGGSSRAQPLAELLERAGLRSRVLTDIRSELWLKTLGAAVLNPLSIITRATLATMCTDPSMRATVYSAMQEVHSVASKLDITFRRTIDERIAGAASVGEHKTSMRQAFDAGLPLELEATTGVVCELGRLTETPTPLVDAIYACTKLLSKESR